MQSSHTQRVALQLSGHLRGLCDSAENFEPLAQLVGACRAQSAQCDLFVHTWDELHARTPAWHTWYPSDVPNAGTSSHGCIDRLTKALKPAAIAVERQTLSRPANETWIVAAGRHRETHVSLAGLRSAIRGVAAASELRQKEERSGRVAPYDIAVRLRPDLYHRRNFRKNRGRGQHYRGIPMNQICSVPAGAWRAIVGASHRCESCVHGCDDETLPGNKSGDMCFWSSPPAALDRLVHRWDAIADEFLDANLCWQRLIPSHLSQQPHTFQSGASSKRAGRLGRKAMAPAQEPPGDSPCPHPETRWDPASAEIILRAAAAREGVIRATLQSGVSSRIARTARCT